MKANMGSADRIVRVLIAALVALLYLTDKINGVLVMVLLVMAVIFTLTGLFKFCPVYLPFGFSSCKKKLQEKTINCQRISGLYKSVLPEIIVNLTRFITHPG